jgi:nucleoside phosphorylase/CheY-like chemotaxis protein
MRILIIEDTPIKARRIAACLEALDPHAKISHAPNARDGLDNVLRGGIDLVLLDVLLPLHPTAEPSEDGSYWFLREIQRKLEGPKHPLIVGTTQHATSLAAAEEAFREYLWCIVFVSENDNRWQRQIAHAVRFANSIAPTYSLLKAAVEPVDVAIVTALRIPEFEELVDALGGGDRLHIPETNEAWMRSTIEIPGGREITTISACADEMGMCAMSALVTRLCIACRPKKLILCGIAGGNEMRVGMSDLIVIEETWDCHAGKITEQGLEADVKPQRCSYKLANAAKDFITEDFLLNLWKNWTGDKPHELPQLRAGAVACSPAVVAHGRSFDQFEDQKRKVLGVEMEAYGCYDAVHRLGSLAPMVISMKSVCDLGDKDKADKYQRYCAYIAGKSAVELIHHREFLDA